ncbi:SIS domain-containing protein [Paraglaciecola sp.]|uniref:SIS domain-containing protein n=1 Tax=Paraglaciecola sp. TaxID=1920173 RepID=UPI003EF2536C
MIDLAKGYLTKLNTATEQFDWALLEPLAEHMLNAIANKKQVFICGNGGSAGNAIHLANDFTYGIHPNGNALRIEALPANAAVLTCLGNDIGYDNIYSHQLKVKANSGDLLIVLSGSGNSPNILNAIEQGKSIGMTTFAILGFSGGQAKAMADYPLHFDIDDMQISEDLQVIVGHMLMQYLHDKLKGGA